MSNNNLDSPTDHTGLSRKHSTATTTSATSGLESMILAIQALQKEPRREVDEEKSTTALLTTTAPVLPPPPAMDSASRVVSTDTISESDCVDESLPRQLSSQVKQEEKSSPPAKASDTTPCSPPLESATRAVVPSSTTSASPPPSERSTDDGPTSTDGTSPKAADFSRILADPEGWLLQTENLFAKLTPVDRSSDIDIVVKPNDVLCGRGGETNHHPGNIRYRSLVKAYQKLYLLAKRRDKPKIAQCIVVSVREVNGRFLKRTKNAKAGWVDVGNVKAREKTSQALREGAPNLRDNVSPPITSSAAIDQHSTAASGRQALVPDQAKSMIAPPAKSATLPTSAPTALEAMMGWRMPTASFNSAISTTTANGSTSSVPPVTSSSALSPSNNETDALTAQVFTKAAAQLMQHPAFHQLDQARQQEAILFELENAKAAVESAKRTSASTGTTAPANNQEQGRISPMTPSDFLKQQQPPQLQQHHHPYKAVGNPYYHHGPHHNYYRHMYGGSYWPEGKVGNHKNPSSMDSKADQAVSLPLTTKLYHEAMVAKAAPASSSGLTSANKNDEKIIPTKTTSEPRRKTKKRPTPPPSCRPTSSLSRSPTVVSDTGSDISSSSSSCSSSIAINCDSFPVSSCNASNTAVKSEVVSSVSRGGSRLKRLKLRMKSDFN